MPKKVGIIGCGTIGTELGLAIDNGKIENAMIEAAYDKFDDAVKLLRSKLEKNTPSVFSDPNQFFFSRSFQSLDVIVEAASQEALRELAQKIIESGKILIAMSVGGLADPVFFSQLLSSLSLNHSSKIYLPTGAIAGIDAIRAVRDVLESVTLVTTKNPKALIGAPFFRITGLDVSAIVERTLIYEGSAADAVKKFPANVNVAAILGLAGLGAEKTNVQIVADPTIDVNRHEIIAKGSFGEMNITVHNRTSPRNAKTSFLAVLSAIECLRSVCNDSIHIGT